MFSGCTSLTTAPDLPAIDINPSTVEWHTNNVYYEMFYGCSNLNYVKAMFINLKERESSDYGDVNRWLDGVAETGTFFRNPNATWTREEAEIPAGWTILDATE